MFRTTRRRGCRDKLSPSQQRVAIIFPIRKTRTNWNERLFPVCHWHKEPPASLVYISEYPLHQQRLGVFVPKTGTRALDDILWEESPSRLFLTHLLYDGVGRFHNHTLQDLWGFGLDLVVCHYEAGWLWTSMTPRHIRQIVYSYCEKTCTCKRKQWLKKNTQTMWKYSCLAVFIRGYMGLRVMPAATWGFCVHSTVIFAEWIC